MNQEQQDEIKRLGLIEIILCKEEKRRDERDNLIWYKNRDGTIEEWKYDEKDNLIWRKNPDGTTEEWKYNDRNNIIWHKHSDGTTKEWKYNDNDEIIWYKTPDEIYYIGNKVYRKVISLDKEESK